MPAGQQIGFRRADQDCEVWTATTDIASDPEAAGRLLDILSFDERSRMASFYFERDRSAYLVAHALLRGALSSRAPETSPAEWRFERDVRGRPEIAAIQNARRLRFNLSHTKGFVACVVATQIDCGIDVEHLDRSNDLAGLGRAVLTPAERAKVAALAPHERAEGFFRYWTLKEAYAKARGLGILLPFRDVEFDLDGSAARLSAGDGEYDRDWQFIQCEEGERHILSLALRRGRTPDRRVMRHKRLPEVICPDHLPISSIDRSSVDAEIQRLAGFHQGLDRT